MTFALIGIAAILAIAFLPQMWIGSVLRRHQSERSDYPGTGAEFARHILDEMKLTGVKVEETRDGDHYDPEAKTVRLSEVHFKGRSLAAVVVAAHEVGHAMQDATQYPPLAARTRLAKSGASIERVGSVIMLAAPLVMVFTKSPALLLMSFLAGAGVMMMSVAIHAVTLPVEFDASFRRALPLLKAGNYIGKRDMASARQLLTAAALTYVSAAAMSLLNVARWLRVLRI